MSSSTLRALSLLAVLAVLAGCGPAPVPIEPASARNALPAGHSADDGHDHGAATAAPGAPPLGALPRDATHAGMADPRAQPGQPAPDGHLPAAGGEPYAGVVRLRGELARVAPSYLFISVMPEGQNLPGCFDRLDLGDAAVGTIDDEGERVIAFSFPSCPIDPSAGGGRVELKVQWDRDGYVNSGDREVAERYPVERGAQDIDVVLQEHGE